MLQPRARPPQAEKIAIRTMIGEEFERLLDADVHSRTQHEPGQRDHDQSRDQRLQHAGNDFLYGNPMDLDRGQQPVFDLASPLKFGDQRHGHRPDSGEDHADGNNARQQQAFVACRQIAAADHHSAENEDEQQRLQEGLQQQLGSALRRATCASRASMAVKVFQFNRAGSFRCGAGKDFPGWARRCARHEARRRQSIASCSDLGDQRAAAIGVDVGARGVRGTHFTNSCQVCSRSSNSGRLLAETAGAADIRRGLTASTRSVCPWR